MPTWAGFVCLVLYFSNKHSPENLLYLVLLFIKRLSLTPPHIHTSHFSNVFSKWRFKRWIAALFLSCSPLISHPLYFVASHSLVSQLLSNFLLSTSSRGSQCFFLIDWFCQTPISTVQGQDWEKKSLRVFVWPHRTLLCFTPSSKPLPDMLARPPRKARICRKAIIIINHKAKPLLRHAAALAAESPPIKALQISTVYNWLSLTVEGAILWASGNNHPTRTHLQHIANSAGSMMFALGSVLFVDICGAYTFWPTSILLDINSHTNLTMCPVCVPNGVHHYTSTGHRMIIMLQYAVLFYTHEHLFHHI